MAVSSEVSRIVHIGNGNTDTYSFPFRVRSQNHINVSVMDDVGDVTDLALGTDFTVTGVNSPSGGQVTLVAGDLPTDHKILIRRIRPVTQDTDIRNQGTFYPETHENEFDSQTYIHQQNTEDNQRSIKINRFEDYTDFDMELPYGLADQQDRLLKVNEFGTGFEFGPTGEEVANAEAFAAAAEAARDAAIVAQDAAEDAQTAAESAQTGSEAARDLSEDYSDLSEEWARKTDDLVEATDNSSKAWAIGGTGLGNPTAGSSKDWAVKTDAAVVTGQYSAKEHATGTQTRGQAGGGSAKDWANYTGSTVDDAGYSAKYWAEQAQATGGALFVTGTIGTPEQIGAGGITPIAGKQRQLFILESTGGQVDVTASPQIAAGTVIGQELLLHGTSDTDAIVLENGNGLLLNGSWLSSVGSMLKLFWRGDVWAEYGRL